MAKQYIMRLTADRCIYYKAFPHEEARKILDKFDIHYTPTGMKKAMPSLALWLILPIPRKCKISLKAALGHCSNTPDLHNGLPTHQYRLLTLTG